MSYPTPGEVLLDKIEGTSQGETFQRLEFDHVQPTEWGVRCFDLEEDEHGVKRATTKMYYPWHRVYAAKRYTETTDE